MAIATIALCIGTTSVLLSFLITLAVHPQNGLDRPSELFQVTTKDGEGRWTYPSSEIAAKIEQESMATATLASYDPQFVGVTIGNQISRVVAEATSRNFFSVLGTQIARGRALIPADLDSGLTTFPVVIGWRLWHDVLGADEHIVGSRVVIQGSPNYIVVGVAAPGFHGPEGLVQSDLWIPMSAPLHGYSRTRVIGRLRNGAALGSASAELETRWRRHERQAEERHPGSRNHQTLLISFLGAGLHNEQFQTLRVLLGGAFAITLGILLLACVNLSGLSLSRVISREREIAVSKAIGARRRDILLDVFTELGVLFALGSSAGVLLARSIAFVLVGALSTPFPFAIDFHPNLLTIVATIGVCLFAIVAAAAAPAFRAASADPANALRADAVASTGSVLIRRTQDALVVLQLCIGVVLLTTSAAVYFSMSRRLHVDMGVTESSQLIVAPLPNGTASVDNSVAANTLAAKLATNRDVQAVAIAYHGPAEGRLLRVFGHTGKMDLRTDSVDISVNTIAPGFFKVVNRLVRGRDFTSADGDDAATVGIVSERLALRLFPRGDAIGKLLTLNGPVPSTLTIIGIAPDIIYDIADEKASGVLYQPFRNGQKGGLSLVVRARGNTAAVSTVIDSLVHVAVPGLFSTRAKTVDGIIAEQLLRSRALVTLLGAAAALTLTLAVLGVYGLVAFNAGQRRREIGVRRVFGATSASIIGLFLRHVAQLTALSLLIGLVASVGIFRMLPATWTSVGLSLPLALGLTTITTAAVATSIFAVFRSAIGDPSDALRGA
jgi:putative ABC transport system permease protein